MKWNDQGTSLIVLAQTDVDKTNKSYYGETNMYILSANGGFDARITLGKYLCNIRLFTELTPVKTRRVQFTM